MRSGSFPALAVGLVLLAAVVVFFPTLFFGRVISPLDTITNSPPWSGIRPSIQVSNPDLEDSAAVSLPAVAAVSRDGWSTALWNPYQATGRTGWLTWGSESLSPFITPFVFWVGQARLLNVTALAKLLAAFGFTYLLLRRHGRSESAAALGSLAFALAAPLTLGWLRAGGGAAALLPMLLWVIDRTNDHLWPLRASAIGFGWLVFAAAGPPTTVMLGAYLTLAWLVWSSVSVGRSKAPGRIASALSGIGAATLVVTPSALMWWRGPAGSKLIGEAAPFSGWGVAALRLLVNPFAFGDPRRETFAPPEPLTGLAFHDVCVTVGWLAVVLAIVGLAVRSRHRWLWVVVSALAAAAMVVTPVGRVLSALPGLGRLDPGHLAIVLALAVAVLAAAGWDGLRVLISPRYATVGATLFGTALVLQQGLLAGHLLTYLPPGEAIFTTTPGLDWLNEHRAPGDRVAPLFRTLLPNTAEAYGLEDVRAHGRTATGYRNLLSRIDPQVTNEQRTILLNGATIDLHHPYLAALGARWILEPPDLNLVEFNLLQEVVELGPATGSIGPVSRRSHVAQALQIPAGCSRIAVPVRSIGTEEVEIELRLTGLDDMLPLAVWRGSVEPALGGVNLWLEVPTAVGPRPVRLHVLGTGGDGQLALRRIEPTAPGVGSLVVDGHKREGALAVQLDMSGYVLAYEGRDIRIWESRSALPRAWLVGRTRPGDLQSLLSTDPPLDLSKTAYVPTTLDIPTLTDSTSEEAPGTVAVELYRPQRLELNVTATRPAVLVTSIAACPSLWRAAVGGMPASLVRVNGIFLGVPLDEGRHHVTLTARLPIGWVIAAGTGVGILLAMLVAAVAGRRRKESS